nr:MAG: hypothetical protein AM324_13100 [Candidatus Thorarchaeota archaeon SMTZ1-83]
MTTTTGGSTEIGKIQGTLGELNTGDIPLRKKVNLLAKYLGITAIVLMVVSVVWQLLVNPFMVGMELDLSLTAIADRMTAGC